MKRRALAVLFGVCSFVAHAEKPKEAAHLVASSYDEAMEIAEKQDRNVYLLFKGNPCVWCERQAVELKDPDVVEAMDGMVFYVVDAYARKDLRNKYGVTSVPSHRLLDPKGETLKSHVGFMDAKMLVEFLEH